jgi:hypothetical protein
LRLRSFFPPFPSWTDRRGKAAKPRSREEGGDDTFPSLCAPAPLRQNFDRKLENQQSGRVKTTLDLPNDLVREVKLRAVNEGRKLKDVISDLLRQGLGHPTSTISQGNARRGRIEFPLFPSSPDAPAQRMSLDELVRAEHETLTRDDLERLRPSA